MDISKFLLDAATAFVALAVAHSFFRPKQKPPRGLHPNCLLTRHPVLFLHGLKNLFTLHDYWNGITRYLSEHGYDIHTPGASWRGPARRRQHSFRNSIFKASELTGKVHLVAYSLGGLDAYEMLCTDPEISARVASLTLVAAPFQGAIWGFLSPPGWMLSDLRKRFLPTHAFKKSQNMKVPENARVGVVRTLGASPTRGAPILFFHNLLASWILKPDEKPHDGLVRLKSQNIPTPNELPIFWDFPGDHFQVIGAGPSPAASKTAHECFLDHCIFLAEQDLIGSK